jgi:hypothetical protein
MSRPPWRSGLNWHLVGPDDVPLAVVLGLDARNYYLAHWVSPRLSVFISGTAKLAVWYPSCL